jgi:hypothetical protein
MKTTLALFAAILALSACGTDPQEARDQAWQVCGSTFNDQARNQCMHNQLRLKAAQARANDNAATLAVLGGTAFVNGYNSGSSGPLPMTNYGGHVTMWSGASGMLQGY